MATRNFRELIEALPRERQQKIEERFQQSMETMPLEDLRRAREMIQLQLGEVLGVPHSEVSTIEHRTDICVRTLVEYVEALGGHLEIRAVFPDREVYISQFEEPPR